MMYGSFEAFYSQTADDCYRAVSVAIRDTEEAADLVGEAFVRALARWDDVAIHPAPTAWVIRTALNLHKDRWRRTRLARRAAVNAATYPEPSLPPDPRLLEALMALPRRQRETVALRVIADLDTRQTAELLGTAGATVRVHLHRALATLRASLIEEDLR